MWCCLRASALGLLVLLTIAPSAWAADGCKIESKGEAFPLEAAGTYPTPLAEATGPRGGGTHSGRAKWPARSVLGGFGLLGPSVGWGPSAFSQPPPAAGCQPVAPGPPLQPALRARPDPACLGPPPSLADTSASIVCKGDIPELAPDDKTWEAALEGLNTSASTASLTLSNITFEAGSFQRMVSLVVGLGALQSVGTIDIEVNQCIMRDTQVGGGRWPGMGHRDWPQGLQTR